jgi:hypothetical protein
MRDDIALHFPPNKITGSSITIEWDEPYAGPELTSTGKVKYNGKTFGKATSYKVYYALVDSGAFVYIPANGEGNNSTTTTSFTHTGLDQGTRYSYWITAGNKYGWSDEYDGYIGYADTIVDHAPDPPQPNNTDEGPVSAWGGPMIALRWKPSPGATSYKIYYREESTSAPLTFAFEYSNDTTVYHGGYVHPYTADQEYLDHYTTYFYYIEAWNSYGHSDAALIGHATTNDGSYISGD